MTKEAPLDEHLNEQEQAKQELLNFITVYDDAKAHKIIEQFSISKETVQEIVEQVMIDKLERDGFINDIICLVKEYSLPKEFIMSPAIQKAAEQRLSKELDKEGFGDALEVKEKFSLPAEIIIKGAKQRLVKELSEGRSGSSLISAIYNKFPYRDEIIKSPEVQEAAKNKFIKDLSIGSTDELFEMKEEFDLPDEIIKSPEVQEAAKKCIMFLLRMTDIDNALKIKEEFDLPDEIIKSPEVQEATKEGISRCFGESYDEFTKSNIYKISEIMRKFPLPEETFREIAIQDIVRRLNSTWRNAAYKIVEEFRSKLPEKNIHEAVVQAIINLLEKGEYIHDILEIKLQFRVPDEIIFASQKIQEKSKKAAIGYLNGNIFGGALDTKDLMSKETILSPEIQEAAKKAMAKCLGMDKKNEADRIKKGFFLSE